MQAKALAVSVRKGAASNELAILLQPVRRLLQMIEASSADMELHERIYQASHKGGLPYERLEALLVQQGLCLKEHRLGFRQPFFAAAVDESPAQAVQGI